MEVGQIAFLSIAIDAAVVSMAVVAYCSYESSSKHCVHARLKTFVSRLLKFPAQRAQFCLQL